MKQESSTLAALLTQRPEAYSGAALFSCCAADHGGEGTEKRACLHVTFTTWLSSRTVYITPHEGTQLDFGCVDEQHEIVVPILGDEGE